MKWKTRVHYCSSLPQTPANCSSLSLHPMRGRRLRDICLVDGACAPFVCRTEWVRESERRRKQRERGCWADWIEETGDNQLSHRSSFQARHAAAMRFSSKLTKKLNNVSISLPECAEHRALRLLPACYRLITGEDDMWRCCRLGIVSLPCPR